MLAVAPPFRLAGYATVYRLWAPVVHNLYLLDQIAFVACVAVRFRRAEGDEVEQFKWFVYVLTVGVIVMVIDRMVLGSASLGLLSSPSCCRDRIGLSAGEVAGCG